MQGPLIKVTPPGKKTEEFYKVLNNYETRSAHGKLEEYLVWERAEGVYIFDIEGNRLLDLTSGFGTAILGYSHPEICKIAKKQIDILTLAPRWGTPYKLELLKTFANLMPVKLQKFYLCSSGAEAVDVALKLARYFTAAIGYISFYGNFHGKTFGALSVSARREYRQRILPLIPTVYFYPYPYCYRCPLGLEYPECSLSCIYLLEESLENPVSGIENISAIIVEPIQGNNGVIVPPKEFLPSLRKMCNKYGILLILDEISTGIGRTGKLFAFEQENVVPDILVFGKGISNGLIPLAGIASNSKIIDCWTPLFQTSTYMANPLACVIANKVLNMVSKREVLKNVCRVGSIFINRFREMQEKYEIIGDVRGKGLMIGVELVKDRKTKTPATKEAEKLCISCIKRGVIIYITGQYSNVIYITPALTIDADKANIALDIIEEALRCLE